MPLLCSWRFRHIATATNTIIFKNKFEDSLTGVDLGPEEHALATLDVGCSVKRVQRRRRRKRKGRGVGVGGGEQGDSDGVE